MIQYNRDFTLDKALHELYQKHNRSPPEIETFIPQHARVLNNVRARPFVPQIVRNALNAASSPFVPQSVREALRSTAPSFIPVAHSTLNAHAPVFEPKQMQLANVAPQAPLQPLSATSAVSTTMNTLSDNAAGSVPSTLVHRVNTVQITTSSQPSSRVPSASTNPDTVTDSSDRVSVDWDTDTSSTSSSFDEVPHTKLDGVESAQNHCLFDVELALVPCVETPRRACTAMSPPEPVIDALLIAVALEDIFNHSPIIGRSLPWVDLSIQQINVLPALPALPALPLLVAIMSQVIKNKVEYALRTHLRSLAELTACDSKAISLSLVHYVDAMAVAQGRLSSSQEPAGSDLVIVNIKLGETPQSIFTTNTLIAFEKLALYQIKMLPALPLLMTILSYHEDEICDFWLGKLVDQASDTEETSIIKETSVSNEALDIEQTAGDISSALLPAVISHTLPPMIGRLRQVMPWETGMGPSFGQAVKEKLVILRSFHGENVPLTEPAPIQSFHHYSYLGQQVPCKSDTDPALSLALIMGESKGAMSELYHESHTHRYVVLNSAFKYVDPVIYHGSLNELDDNITISEIRAAATGKVNKYYRPCGTWLHDQYDQTAPIYWDDGSAARLPPVFVEVNDFGASGAFTWSGESFQNQIDTAYGIELHKRKVHWTKQVDPAYEPEIHGSPPQRKIWPGPVRSKMQEVFTANPPISVSPVVAIPATPRPSVTKSAAVQSIVFGRFLEPSKKSWAQLDEEDSDDEDDVSESNISINAEEIVNADSVVAESSSCQARSPTTKNEKGSASKDKCNLFVPETAESERLARAKQMDLLRQRGASNPMGYDELLSYEDIASDNNDDEENPLTANEEEMSPILVARVRRSVSNPLPEAVDMFEQSMTGRSTSAPGSIPFKLPLRQRRSIPRSQGFLDFADIPPLPLPSLSGRPEASPSPLMLAAVAENEEYVTESAAEEDAEERETRLALSEINLAYRAEKGIPEPGLPPIPRYPALNGRGRYEFSTPSSLTKYRNEKKVINKLPKILSSESAREESAVGTGAISYTPPPPAPRRVDDAEPDSDSESSLISERAIFGSSPPSTPTRSAGLVLEEETPTRADPTSLLDGISTSPLNDSSPMRQPTHRFGGLFAVDSSPEPESRQEATGDADEDDESLQAEFATFRPSTLVQVSETPAPSTNSATVYGRMSIASHPEVKKAWSLSRMKSMLGKPKEERAVLKKKHSRKVSGGTTLSGTTKASSTEGGSTKKKGFWGSVKSRVSSTIRRK